MDPRPCRFSAALDAARAAGRRPLITEIKVKSPKEGDLLAGRDPVILARHMVDAGAACLSVVTEGPHFGGSSELLRAVATAVPVPILRKDFVTEPAQVWETRALGASCLLLMVAMLEWPRLLELHEEARRCGIETLVEVHDEQELEQALTLDLDLLGINNRDIRQLEMDEGGPSKTLELLRRVPAGVRVVSESAIGSPAQAQALVAAGAAGLLVGTAILRASDVGEAVSRFAMGEVV